MDIIEMRRLKEEAEVRINLILANLVIETGMSILIGSDFIQQVGMPDGVRVRITMEIK